MNQRNIVSYALTAALVLLSGIGTTYLTWMLFDTVRNSDGAWDDALLPFAFLPCFLLWAAISVLGGFAYACQPSNRRRLVAVVCSAYTVLVPFLGCSAGKYLWQHEFDVNRRSADEVVEAIQLHREKHGTYPARLAELEAPVRTTFQRGRHEHRLEYHRRGKGGFVVEYHYGWYCYRYDSHEADWSRFD
ncbi:MAG TPA: hypothetical protein VH643_23610 [Gemmataceae bacterium]